MVASIMGATNYKWASSPIIVGKPPLKSEIIAFLESNSSLFSTWIHCEKDEKW